MEAKEIAENGLILKCRVGSEAHGINIPGADDKDYIGICLEPPEYVIGLRKFEQYVFRTKPEGVRSEAGDIDSTIYSLRKWCSLALNGNPSILVALYAYPTVLSGEGQELVDNAHWFASRQAGNRFVGYLINQKLRLLGEKGQMNVKRPELIEQFGYDTKYAMHMIRLGLQGVEYLATGRLTLPMGERCRGYILSVRRGEIPLEEIIKKANELESQIRHLTGRGPLPEKPDYDSVQQFLVKTYMNYWEH